MKTLWALGILTKSAGAFVTLCVSLRAFQSPGAVNLTFATSDYGLRGDGPGDLSNLLVDPNGIDSCHIVTHGITPVGGHVDVNSLLGINSPGSDGDNLFEPNGQESWTFGWDQNVVLNSIDLLRARLSAPTASPLVMTIHSDAWIGQTWRYSPGDTNRVYNFDSLTGTFTFTGYPTNSEAQTRLVFAPAEVFDSAVLLVPAGASITVRNDGLTWAGIRGLNFTIVPEPSIASLFLLLGGLQLFGRHRSNVQQLRRPAR